MQKKNPKAKDTDFEQLGKMLANIYESGYIDKNQAYKMSFIKGVLAGLGGVIGATVVVAFLLWVLTLFDTVPLVGPFTQQVQQTIDSSK